MNNLKRVLSLALSGIMLVGMMAVGAGAVNGKDFTDADKIQNTEAVNTLVTLNVINGKDDGSHYDPEGTLTRAEMCKLIVYVLNGGAEPVMSTKATPTYSDIKGHWAEKYIEYCSNLKIVAGQGDGTFNPGGVLTGSQAAKMMLTAMNYNSDVFHFTGADWELSVNSEANKAKLYDGLAGLDASAPINRDNAAQLVYNGLLSKTMDRTWNQNMSDLAITETYALTGPTLFSQKFNGVAHEGVLKTSGKASMDGTSAVKDSFKVNVVKTDGVELVNSSGVATPSMMTFKWADHDLTDLLGEYVKVLYNKTKKEVYGVYRVEDKNTVVKTTSDKISDLTTDSIKADGTTYDVASTFTYSGNSSVADTVKLVDNDGDGALDLAITTPVAVHKVSYVSTTAFTLGTKTCGTYNIPSLSNKFADVIVYDDMKKDDVVVVYEDDYTNKVMVEKADVVKDVAVAAYNNTNSKYRLDGTWYKNQSGTTIELGNTVEFFAIGGVIYYAKVTSGVSNLDSVAMVITYGGENGIDGDRVKLMFSDGSMKTVTKGNLYKDDETLGSDTHTATLGDSGDIKAGDIVTFEVASNGNYNLKMINDFGSYDKMSTLTLKDSNGATTGTNNVAQVDTTVIADDAVVFFFKGANVGQANSANDGKIYTGKDIKSTTIDACSISGAAQAALTKATNGLTRVAAVAMAETAFPTTTSKANYGYIVATPYQVTDNGTKYMTYKVWNGEATETYRVKTDSATPVAKFGEVIGYDIDSGDVIKGVQKITLATAAVKGLDGKDISFNGTYSLANVNDTDTFKLDGNTKYLYVDSSADEPEDIGQTGGDVQRAYNPTGSIYVKNVLVSAKSATDKTIDIIVVDTNRKIAYQSTDAKGDLTITDTNGLVAAGTVTVALDDDKYTASDADVITTGVALKITNNDTVARYYQVAGGATVAKTTLAAGQSVIVYLDGNTSTVTITNA